jgi:hypothetical protein
MPGIEGPGRLTKQLATLAQALAIVRGEAHVSPETYRVIEHVGLDCVPAIRRLLVDALLDRYEAFLDPADTTTVAEAIHYPTDTTRRYLEELTALGLADRHPHDTGRAHRWTLRQSAISLITDLHKPLEKVTEGGNDGP